MYGEKKKIPIGSRYFILSGCPESRKEEKWLEKTMKEKFNVLHFGISAGVLGGNKHHTN